MEPIKTTDIWGKNAAPQAMPAQAPVSETPPPAPAPAQQTSANPAITIRPEVPRKALPWKKFVLIALAILAFSGLGAFGMQSFATYEKYAKPLPVTSLLPADPNLVLTININPDSAQFQLLEKHLQKFPAYALLKQKLDEKSDNKTVSDSLQAKIKEYDLDFQQDLRPAFGEKAYVVINDLSPLGTEIEKRANLAFLSQPSDAQLALNTDAAAPAVLGEATEKKPATASELPVLDFLAITEIRDLPKAKDALQKLQQRKASEVTKRSYGGYDYYEIKLPASTDDKTQTREKLYNAIIGKNWVVASKEEDLKKTIDTAAQKRLLNNFSPAKKAASLAENSDFQLISNKLTSKVGSDALFSVYVKLNFNTFFKEKACQGNESSCTDFSDLLKSPDDIIVGLDFRSNEEGIGVTTVSNRQNIQGVKNLSLANGLVKRFPGQVGELWGDIFIEYSDFNSLYYSFKKNNLTDKGLEEWQKATETLNNLLNINLEADIVDQINGDAGFLLYTKAGKEPEGVFLVPVKDSQQAYLTMEKISEALKKILLERASLMGKYLAGAQGAQAAQYQLAFKKQLADIAAAKITTTETPQGKIHSFKIPGNKFISFDFSVENNELIFSSHYDALETVLKAAQTSPANALDKNDLYGKALSYAPNEGYAQSFIVTQGLVNTATYLMQNLLGILTGGMEMPTQSSQAVQPAAAEEDGYLFALGAILRTIKFVHATQATEGAFTQSTNFFNIVELPQEEKARAEKVLQKMSEEEALAKDAAAKFQTAK